MDTTFSLRPSAAIDAPFVFSTIEETMREHVIATWGRWDGSRVRHEAAKLSCSNAAQITEVAEQPAGLVVVERLQTHIQLEQLLILPAYQRKGIGRVLIVDLAQEAQARSIPVCLRLLAVNPARSFYEKLGFRVTASTPERFFMALPGS
ncbi:hypothetical protein LPB72_06380 [Hydrogenophaga crassostreae]|uniref:N-acetyltransferase domain-containing protein n=1 Tax=Hydrogenophaga crassostreae TaxID=1763535 RepID=A0A162W147_9BURK|nr:GNAT family N-acetyltransferase [Hydrogenophaga crassostreae]AOW14172.1 hypothetical protein LPB072_16335 [Hydrogenophaga crassostreae]OAD42898.1 hypothetical protein LPB72_06380 [Hydrogenophaga crassostreae]